MGVGANIWKHHPTKGFVALNALSNFSSLVRIVFSSCNKHIIDYFHSSFNVLDFQWYVHDGMLHVWVCFQ
jgi:hypothetical protein